MTIGRNNEAPAAYALTSTIKRLLAHLREVDLYSEKDLTHCSHTLERLRKIVKDAEGEYSPYFITLLSNRVELCQATLTDLQNRLDRLGGDLLSIHEKLISILRSISLANTKTKVRPDLLYSAYRLSDVASANTSQFSSQQQKSRNCKLS